MWKLNDFFLKSIDNFTERRGQVVNTPASYSGGPRFKSRSRRPAIPTEVFLLFYSVAPGECRDKTLKLGRDRFLPNLFQFIVIHLSTLSSTLCSLDTNKKFW
jgi:hypothetical protein